VRWSRAWQQARDQTRKQHEKKYDKVGVAPRSVERDEVEKAVAARCKLEYGIEVSDGLGRPSNIDESSWLAMYQEELRRLVTAHRHARGQRVLLEADEEAAGTAPPTTEPVSAGAEDVTVAPWSDPPNVTLPPLDQDLCGNRDIATGGNRDNAEATPSCDDAVLPAELLNEYTSSVDEVVDDRGLVDDSERGAIVDPEETGEE
jgi:hypothetical protein